MSSSLADIWDDPVIEGISKRHKTPLPGDSDVEDSPRPTKRARTLFLPGSDDDGSDIEATTRLPPPKDIDIDVLFAGLDDEDETAYKPLHVVSADEMERQIEAQYRTSHPPLTLHQIVSSSSPARDTGEDTRKIKKDSDEKKPKRRPVLMNEGLLLSPKGFPELIKNVKGFKVKGKGHEASDLNRLLGIYQFWTHGLYPKTQFRDTVTRIEKICHTKRMQVALSVWKDEAKGLPPQPGDSGDEDMEATTESSWQVSQQSSAETRSESRDTSTSPPPSRQPTSASNYDDLFDDDLEALLEEGGTTSAQSGAISSSTSKTTTTSTEATTEDAFWAAMDEVDDGPGVAEPPPPIDVPMDEDQDIWDTIDEMTGEESANPDKAPQPSPQRPPPSPSQWYADPSDWDDMYI